jgi:hypothetical protein
MGIIAVRMDLFLSSSSFLRPKILSFLFTPQKCPLKHFVHARATKLSRSLKALKIINNQQRKGVQEKERKCSK